MLNDILIVIAGTLMALGTILCGIGFLQPIYSDKDSPWVISGMFCYGLCMICAVVGLIAQVLG